jgi:hypothetical protein
MAGVYCYDAIITLKNGNHLTEKDIRNEGWIWNNTMRIWNSDLNLVASAMQVLSSFRDKLTYVLATAYGYKYRGWEKRVQEVKDVFAKYLPGVELDADIDPSDFNPFRCIGTNQYILYPFLKHHKITIEEFLTNSKYVVVVNYPEFEKMRWLDMVDDSQIVDTYYPYRDNAIEKRMVIEDGAWKLTNSDISFGRYPFRVLGTPEGKARYALAMAHSENIDEVLAIMQEVYPEMQRIELPKSQYGDNGIDCGYCEHYGTIIPDTLSLRDFILNKKYVVISDGDEYCVWNYFKRTPLFNQDAYPEEQIDDRY